jgi:hypothetical protein
MLLHDVSPRRDRSASTVPPIPSRDRGEAVERLRPLLEAAAGLDLDDEAAWGSLRETARARIGTLIAGGRLPAHLAVAPTDPPVVVTRSIVAAWRYATDAPTSRR